MNVKNMIHYTTPYNTSGNIGKGINDAVSKTGNDDDWICLLDGDTMFLRSDWGKRIEDTVNQFGDQYGLISCFTNRLNPNQMIHQLHNGICSKETDILKHLEIYDSYPKESSISDVSKGRVIAGFFMLFRKKTWLEVGGFAENTIHFDSDFSIKCQKKGFKLGIMNNLYIFHLYRIWDLGNSPEVNTKHLV